MPVPKAADFANLLSMAEALSHDLEEIEKLARLSTDPAASADERRNAAMAACARLRKAKAFEWMGGAVKWMRDNREKLEKFSTGVAFLNALTRK